MIRKAVTGGLLTAALVLAMGPARAQTVPGAPAPALGAPVHTAPIGGAKADAPQNDASTGGPALSDYKLGISDRLRVTVYNEPDLSGEFAVNANGVLPLPLIGDVSVLGDTVNQIAQKIQQKLADGYLKDPHVSLEVITFRPFFIMGEVNKPGEYPYSNGLTVSNAVARAGGFTYRANKGTFFIRHMGSDEEIKGTIKPGLEIQPGDTIRIGERYF